MSQFKVNPALLKGEVILEARNISKVYGSTHALKEVNFEIRRGEVTTLFGENGAGKSTLMKILSGVINPSAGEIVLNGENKVFHSATEARDCGISIIHQELNLAPNMNVRDNIFIGREIMKPGGVDYAEEARITRHLMEALEEEIDPLTPVENLRLGQQQIVEIARALSVNSQILIMDEPTSALSAAEVEVLFQVIRDLTSQGVAIVYISHHLEEALEITDRAVVLRDGVMTAYAKRDEINLEWIVRNMVGDHFDLGSPPQGYEFGHTALEVKDLTVKGEAGRLHQSSGSILLENDDVSSLSISQRIAGGLALVPEDRQRDGLVQTMTVGENLSLASISDFVRGLILSTRREKQLINDGIRNVTVKTAGGEAAIGSLSGGNQQKVVIGKMLATRPKIILLDEPSRGIDIGAKAEVFRLLADNAKKGLAVIYTTSEVGECLSIAHRIVVMSKGRISAIFDSSVTKERIMAASGESLVA